jgi:hypothetical protein
LPTAAEYLRSLGDEVHPRFVKMAEYPRPVDLRWVDPQHPTRPVPKSSTKQVWMQARAPIGDDVRRQQCALAYASDMAFMESALRPHGLMWTTPGLQAASLDHAMWFHHPFDFNDWILFLAGQSVGLTGPGAGARPDVHPRRQAGGLGGPGMPDAGAEGLGALRGEVDASFPQKPYENKGLHQSETRDSCIARLALGDRLAANADRRHAGLA